MLILLDYFSYLQSLFGVMGGAPVSYRYPGDF
jgi:hypothetical protein